MTARCLAAMGRPALVVLVVVLASGSSHEAKAGTDAHFRGLSGLETVPLGPLHGNIGDWVRYRVANEVIQELSFLTLVLTDRDDDGGSWLEVRLSRSPRAPTSDLTVRSLMRTDELGRLVTERMMVRMGAGRPLEVDLESMPDKADASETSILGKAAPCVVPDSHACLLATSQGLDVQRRPAETVMTAGGSMRVVPLQIRFDDGRVMMLTVSEQVPITALVLARTPDGTHLELDGLGTGAESNMPEPEKVVPYSELGTALSSGDTAGVALQGVGRLVNPEEAREESRNRRASSTKSFEDEGESQKAAEEEMAR